MWSRREQRHWPHARYEVPLGRRAERSAGNHVGQALAFDQLHRVEVHILFESDRVDGHDVRVIERRGGPRFVFEPLQLTPIEDGGIRQNLECHATAQRLLLGLVHHAHPAAPDFADQAEISQLSPVRRHFKLVRLGDARGRSEIDPCHGLGPGK